MAAIANIVINDGQGTPAAHTFSPTDATTALAAWHERVSGIDIGFPGITTSLKKQGTVNRFTVKVAVPTLEVISGSDGGYTPSPRVAYVTQANLEFLLPVRSTLQERKNIEAYVKNLLSNSFITAAIENLERTY